MKILRRSMLLLLQIDEPEITLIEDEQSDYITDRNDDTLHGSTIPIQSYTSSIPPIDSSVTTPKMNFTVADSVSSEHSWQSPAVSNGSLMLWYLLSSEVMLHNLQFSALVLTYRGNPLNK